MAKFDYAIAHVPGKLLYTANTLSRDPIPIQEPDSLQEEVETFVYSMTKSLPATEQRMETYRQTQEHDSVCSQVREFAEVSGLRSNWYHRSLFPTGRFRETSPFAII